MTRGHTMTISLNPNLTQEKKDTRELQINNQENVIQHKPIPNQEENKEANNDKILEAQDNNNQDSKENLPTQNKDTLSVSPKKDNENTNQESNQDLEPQTNQNTQDNQDLQNTKNQDNPLLQDKDYLDFVEKTYHARKSHERLQENSYLRQFIAGAKGLAKNVNEGKFVTVIGDIKNYIDAAQSEEDSIKHDETTLYDYLAQYGNLFNFNNIDTKMLEEAKTRQRIQQTQDVTKLSQEDKDYLLESDTLAGRVWDKITFKDEKKRLEDNKKNLQRQQVDAQLVTDLVKLADVNNYHSLMSLFKSDETNKENLNRFLTEGTQLAKRYGYDHLALDKKTKEAVLIKDGKVYKPDVEGFFRNFDKLIANNFTDIALSLIPIGGGAKVAYETGKIATQGLAKTALAGGAVSTAASPIDYMQNKKNLGLDTNTQELLDYTAGNAIGSVVGTFAIGGVIKGIQKAIHVKDGIKNLNFEDIQNTKFNNIFSNEDMAIQRKLAKFDKKELDSNYEAFKKIQSDTIISKDIQDTTLVGRFLDKVNEYNPINKFTTKKETQERLLSSIFSNKELSKEFAGQLTAQEAQIINRAVNKMGENFTNLSKQFEQELINEYVKSGKTQIDSIPALYKNMLDEIDKEIKINYQKSIKNLHDTLRDRDFKSDILTSYKKITDDALQTLGIDSELTRTLVRETKRVDSMPSIPLNEAIELRKNINEILRNYDKRRSDLKRFRAKNHLDTMKNTIDSNIEKHVYNKVAKNEIDSQTATKLLDDFRLANAEYANIKELLSDKFAKAINKGMNKKDLDSRLTIEQWKQRVLDTNWGDSVKGLKNTIFKNFHPRMQENTQVLLILRALDRNIHLNTDSTPINFTKILSDLEQLENMTLAPKVYPILDLFKSYANAYQFSLELAKPKSLEMMHGGGALSTTLTGRMQVFLTNRLFKNLFSFIPYLGDNNAVLKSLSKAIKNLKYPSEITLETLNQLSKNDLERGVRPSNTPQPSGNTNKKANITSDRDVISHSEALAEESITKENNNISIKKALSQLEATPTPAKLTSQEIENIIKQFDNVENLKEHLHTRTDSKVRESLFNLLETTMQNPHIHYIKDNRDKRLKKFQSNAEDPYFYLLITRDNDKIFITHLKTRDLSYISKQIQEADKIIKSVDIIDDFRQQAGSGNLISSTPNNYNYIIQKLTNTATRKRLTKSNKRRIHRGNPNRTKKKRFNNISK